MTASTPDTLYRIPSGMGGTFTVKILEILDERRALVQIDMPRNPDWHGFRFNADRTALTEED